MDQKATTANRPIPDNWRDFFPLPEIRQKQERALDFIYRMVARGIKDIIVAAPTGTGKSAIGAAVAFWTGQKNFPLNGVEGAYYLCTQKLLQDQLENDIARYPVVLQSAASLKSSSEYECKMYGDCGTGMRHKPACSYATGGGCTYKRQKSKFLRSQLAITNYPYFFTEHAYVGEFPMRTVLIADECHTLENQLLKFVELVIGPDEIAKFLPTAREVPNLPTIEDFYDWLYDVFLAGLKTYREAFDEENLDSNRAKQLAELDNMIARCERAMFGIHDDPKNWVYWQETDSKPGNPPLHISICKPLSAAPFFRDFIQGTSDVRIYMSAYPGSKDIFCRTLGLDPTTTAMLNLGSVFPKEHRPIHAALVGSMSKVNQAATLPHFLNVLGKIMDTHGPEKGIIHCNSYALGDAIHNHFRNKPQGARLLYPKKADEREDVYTRHRSSKANTVILSPSFTEGFDFADDFARWQVIAKVPYPYLGDKQVSAKKDMDPEWYAMRAVMTIIQASGRICRNEQDFGVTYITDADFKMLWEKHDYMFPNWWKEALQWH